MAILTVITTSSQPYPVPLTNPKSHLLSRSCSPGLPASFPSPPAYVEAPPHPSNTPPLPTPSGGGVGYPGGGRGASFISPRQYAGRGKLPSLPFRGGRGFLYKS